VRSTILFKVESHSLCPHRIGINALDFFLLVAASTHGGNHLGQGIGTLVGLIVTFSVTFAILTFGLFIPPDVVAPGLIVAFLTFTDLEIKLVVMGTVLYPPDLGVGLAYGAQDVPVLTFLTWGLGGLIAGLLSKDILPGVLSALFSAIIGAFLVWLLVFFVKVPDFTQIAGTESMLLLQRVLIGTLYPAIATAVGGLLGGGISRQR